MPSIPLNINDPTAKMKRYYLVPFTVFMDSGVKGVLDHIQRYIICIPIIFPTKISSHSFHKIQYFCVVYAFRLTKFQEIVLDMLSIAEKDISKLQNFTESSKTDSVGTDNYNA